MEGGGEAPQGAGETGDGTAGCIRVNYSDL